MKFCENCGNMYYIKIDDEKSNILNYYCRKCGNIDKNYTQDNICVSKTSLKENNKEINYFINETPEQRISILEKQGHKIKILDSIEDLKF